MKALAIAATGVRRLFRDRQAAFFTFVFPLIMIVLIGIAFGDEDTARLGVVAVDSGQLGEELVSALEQTEGLEIRRFDNEDDWREAIERGEVEAGVLIPPGYDSQLHSGGQVDLPFLLRPDGLGDTLWLPVQATVEQQAELIRAALFAQSERGISFDDALAQATELRQNLPQVTVNFTIAGEPERALGRFDTGVAQQLLLFMFLTSLSASDHLILSRQLGVSRRMLSTPTAVRSIVFGETLGRFAVAMIQGLFIVLASIVLFGVDWGDPVAAGVIVVLFALVGIGAGMLLGTLLKTPQQAAAIGVFLGLGLAALGGCMVPLEVFPETMRKVAHITPHAWALDAFGMLLRRHGTLADIRPEMVLLAAYAALLLFAATWRFRRSIAG